jgi:hypothetical protein
VSYGKVHDVYWEDDKIELLSDRAALLGLFLITGPHRNAIGCFKLGTGAISDNPRFGGWGIEGVCHALSELEQIGFLVRDQRTGWTFVRNALKHDPVKGAKAAIHAAKLAAAVPKNTAVYQELKSRLEPLLEVELEGHRGAIGYPMEPPSMGDAIPQPSPSPEPSPEPEPKECPSDTRQRDEPELAEALADWNAVAERKGLPALRVATGERKSKLRQRLAEHGLDGWREALVKLEASSFCCGDSPSGWRANIDFVLRKSSFVKLLEGAYDDTERTFGGPSRAPPGAGARRFCR